jgi:low affinity Fe/Cu permease
MNMDLNTILGLLASALISILLFQMRGQRKDSRAIGEKLDAHILEITKALALKVDEDRCKGTRIECIGLNHKIIKDPLQAQINEINRKRRDRWSQQAEENRQLWEAFRGHSHTSFADPGKDNIIIKKD